MAKTILKKELVYLDFRKREYKFYNVEVLSVGYNDIQVIFNYGRLGTKGKEMVERINQGKSTYKESMKIAYNKIYKKKLDGFISIEKMEEGLKYAIKQENKSPSQNKGNDKKCDICKTPINQKLYEKIDSWGRKEGNWDFSKDSPLYKKVVCLDCQIEQDIFQKKIDENTKINFK